MFGDINELLKKVEELKALQQEHVTIANITFKKSDVKRVEPYTQPKEGGGNINVTRVIWEGNDDDTILPVSIQQFNDQFYK